MKKIIFVSLLIFVFTSCNKDFDTINDNKKAATDVPASTLFSNAQKGLVDNMTTPDVNVNIFRLLAQQWCETTYADESQYNVTTRNNARNFWNPMYRDVLKDFAEAKRLALIDATILDESVRSNQVALTEILSVYAFSVLVNTFGDIPYSQALDYKNIYPKYDDAATIYADLLKRLDDAMASMDPGAGSFGDADIIYKGDVATWMKFANSLKLRLGMTLADVDQATAKKAAEEAAAGGVFTSNADNALFGYLSSPPNTNQVWVNLIQSQRIDFLASNTMVDIMKPLNDPRLPGFFNRFNGDFVGGIYGQVNPNNKSSLPSDKITATTFPGDLLDYAEVEFYLAEAVERGFAVGGTAADHYNNAVTASILYWGGTADQAATYLSKPAVAYATAAGGYKQKIGTQKWIALYNRGQEAWTEYRRFDYPVLNTVSADDAQGPFPLRFPYSDQEAALNTDNFNAAMTKAGVAPGSSTNIVTVRLFWDKQ